MELAEKKSIEAFALNIRMAALEAIHSIGSAPFARSLSCS